MKRLIIPLFAFTFVLHLTSEALPQKWDVDLAAQPPQVFTLQRPRGETYELEAVLKYRGKPFAPAITNACIYWQTNGMENLYWSAPASVSNNVLRASWLPSMDPGAATVRGYIGDPGHIYAAAFQFRFISSPGATPNALPLPVPVIDFAKVRVLNPPWESGGGGGVNTNAVRDIAAEVVAPVASSVSDLSSSVSRLESSKLDRADVVSPSEGAVEKQAADAYQTYVIFDGIYGTIGIIQGDLAGMYSDLASLSGTVDQKADKVSGATEGNFASLDANGNLVDSGKSESDFATAYQVSILARDVGLAMESLTRKLDAPAASAVTDGHVAVFDIESGAVKVKDGGDLPVISSTDPTFTNAVIETMKGVTPQPSPELRLWDPVLNRWVILKSVNMNITLEVE